MDKRQATEFLGYLLRDKNIERTIYEDALKIAIESLKAQLSKESTTKDATSDLISRQAAIDALDCINGTEEVLRSLPSAQPEYEPADVEDFAKTMSENTLYNFMAWNNVAFTLMNEMGFVICKKRM